MNNQTSTPSKISASSKFEQDLAVYFPDLYKFWSLFDWDKKYECVMQGILEMVNENGYGTLKITYQQGKISYVNLDKQLTANTGPKRIK